MSVIQLESSEALRAGESPAEVRLADPVIPLRRRLAPVFSTMGRIGWMLLDAAIGAGAAAGAFALTPYAEALPELKSHLSPQAAMPVLGIGVALAARILGLGDRLGRRSAPDLVVRCLLVTGLSVMLAMLTAKLFFYQDIGRHIIAWSSLLVLAGLSVSRAFAWHYASRHPERVGVVGDAEFIRTARRHLDQSGRPVLLNCLDISGATPAAIRSLPEWAVDKSVDEIVYADQPDKTLQSALLRCLDRGVRVGTFASHMERNCEYVPLDLIDHEWFLGQDMRAMHPGYVVLKRLMDVTFAGIGIVLAAPLIALAAVAVKIESPGPAFYRQIRVGLRNRPFHIWKIRSMRLDAEADGAQWARKKDSRITRVGRLLRKTRLDEVPQFLNILKGDMAFIGPRPERPEFVDALSEAIPWYRQRQLVKPGLTGWAQINADYGGTIEDSEEKLRYDLYYVKHASIEFDLHICVRTIGAIMRGSR